MCFRAFHPFHKWSIFGINFFDFESICQYIFSIFIIPSASVAASVFPIYLFKKMEPTGFQKATQGAPKASQQCRPRGSRRRPWEHPHNSVPLPLVRHHTEWHPPDVPQRRFGTETLNLLFLIRFCIRKQKTEKSIKKWPLPPLPPPLLPETPTATFKSHLLPSVEQNKGREKGRKDNLKKRRCSYTLDYIHELTNENSKTILR